MAAQWWTGGSRGTEPNLAGTGVTAGSVSSGAGRRARGGVRGLSPGYFALVMATGIVSRALRADGWLPGAAVLFWIGVLAFVVLAVATAWRLVRYRTELWADVLDPSRAFAFFTFGAAANVLASAVATDGYTGVAVGLLVLGGLAWVVLGYAVPAVLILRHGARSALAGVNGTWFIWVVGAQSVAVAAASVSPSLGGSLAGLAMVCWSVGVVLYLLVATFVLGGLLWRPVRPADLAPAYWVFMGATAISVLAGAQILRLGGNPLVTASAPVVAGASVVLWAFGTWLVPLLVAAGVWRHGVRRVSLAYEPGLWSIVFPLGMYGVASRELGAVLRAPGLVDLGAVEAWIAAAVWLVVFAAMLCSLARKPLARRTTRQGGLGN